MRPCHSMLALAPSLALAVALAVPAAPAQSQPGPPRATLFQPVMPAPALPAPQPSALKTPAFRLAASGTPLSPSFGPGQQCRAAIRNAERAAAIPNQLMAAIARVESGRKEPDGTVNPWPWSINVEGEDHIYDTKAQAIAAVQAFQAKGTRSIDVGCMQVNLMYHPDAFPTLDRAFDPVANANYAAKFLVQLHDQTGTWPTATAWYHSATPDLGADYQRRVMAVWPEEQKRPDAVPPVLATTYASNFASGFSGGFHGGFANGFASGFAGGIGRPAGGFTTSNQAEAARIIPLPPGAVGRGLAAYRATPVAVVTRPVAMPLAPAQAPALREAGNPG